MSKILDQLKKAMIYVTARLNQFHAYHDFFGLDMPEEKRRRLAAMGRPEPQYEQMLVNYPEVKQ